MRILWKKTGDICFRKWKIPAHLAVFLAFASPSYAFDPADAARINELIDTGMTYYWTGGDVKKAEAELFKGITLHGRYDVVEQSFTEASALAPERLDLRYAIASTQVIQANLGAARATYQKILSLEPSAFEAQAWMEAIALIQGDELQAELAHQALAGMDRDRAEAYRQRFLRAEEIIDEPLNFDIPQVSGSVMIVTLGYVLADDGTAQQPLLDRLDVALQVAKTNPEARLMVTGGVPKSGVTEGDVMTKWLVEQGIDRDRILIEDKSKDTVGNVLNVANLLARHKADKVILVTSSSHMRRARVVLEDALQQYNLATEVIPVSALDAENREEAAVVPPAERMAVFRDLMRVSGIWAYPGFQQ